MAVTFVLWCMMTWFALCIGLLFYKVWFWANGQRRNVATDETLLMGICMLTVYAEVFSLFAGVGGISATLLLAVVCLTVSYRNRKEWKEALLQCTKIKKKYWLVIAVLLIGMLAVGASEETVYDTGLYHAQAIRWIEEYGVVKGLGCLHNRFAYNSAFLVLQALFGGGGGRRLFGLELHSVNAYLAFVLIVWAGFSLTFWKKKTISVSDMGRLLFFIYLFTMRNRISSPGTDFFAISMAIYVLTKWTELLERQCEDAEPYLCLCFLAVYALTLKLSAAPVVLLAVYALYLLIRGKQYRLLCISLVIGLCIALPFLIRNVIISGYLLYPFPSIDIFSVDWKMAIEDVIYDKNEIAAWGRGLREQSQFAYPLRRWFPMWWDTLSVISKLSVILFPFSFAVMLIRCAACVLPGRSFRAEAGMITVYLAECGMVFLWFTSAPIIRYGGIFLLLVPFTLAGEFVSRRQAVILSKAAVFMTLVPVCLIMMWHILGVKIHYIRPDAYAHYEMESCELSGIVFFYPVKGDQAGYDPFPSTPSKEKITEQKIELRGEDLRDGFRLKSGRSNDIIKED